jgi:replication initiation protein RepC
MPTGNIRRQQDPAIFRPQRPTYGLDRWLLLDKVKALRQLFKLNDRDITVLQAHLSVLPKGLLNAAALNMSYMKVKDILERANGMDEKAFRRSEVRLEAAGLIKRKLSANGRRFPVYQDHKIMTAYGIDLAPLIAKSNELDIMIRDVEALDQERRALTTSISCKLQDYKRAMMDIGSRALEALNSFIQEIRNVLRRKSTSLSDLEEMSQRVDDYGQKIEATSSLDTGVQKDNPADKTNDDDGQYVLHIESPKKETIKKRCGTEIFDPARIRKVWVEVPALSEFYPDAPVQERQLAEVLFEFSSFLGLKKETMLEAAAAFGWEKLSYCLNYLTSRIEHIQKPDGYMRSMIKGYESGQAVAGGRISASRDILSGTPV